MSESGGVSPEKTTDESSRSHGSSRWFLLVVGVLLGASLVVVLGLTVHNDPASTTVPPSIPTGPSH